MKEVERNGQAPKRRTKKQGGPSTKPQAKAGGQPQLNDRQQLFATGLDVGRELGVIQDNIQRLQKELANEKSKEQVLMARINEMGDELSQPVA